MPVDTNGVLEIATPRVFAPLLVQGKRYYGSKGGRASGKSHFMAERLVEEAIARPGLRVLCVRETQKSLKESAKKLIEDKIQALGVGHLFEVLRDEIRGPGNGAFSFIGMQSHNAESAKGFEGVDIAWAEEASSLSERSIKLLIPTIRAEGSQLWFSWNPRRRADPVEKLIPWHDTERAVLVHANYKDNPFLPRVMLDEAVAAKELSEDDYAHVWLGGYENLGSKVVIPAQWIDAAVGLCERLGIEPEGRRYSALDVAGAEEGGDENAQAIRHGIELQFIDKWNGLDTSLTTQRAVANMAARSVTEGYYDVVGVGEGVTGEWASMGRRGEAPDGIEMIPWNGGMGVLEPDARINPDDDDSPRNRDQYANLKAQAWFMLRRRFENAYKASKGRPYDADMLISLPRSLPFLGQIQDELTQPQQKYSGTGKVLVDKQPDGARSPNLADAIAMCFLPLGGATSYSLDVWCS